MSAPATSAAAARASQAMVDWICPATLGTQTPWRRLTSRAGQDAAALGLDWVKLNAIDAERRASG